MPHLAKTCRVRNLKLGMVVVNPDARTEKTVVFPPQRCGKGYYRVETNKEVINLHGDTVVIIK